jgi:hypothetical protein
VGGGDVEADAAGAAAVDHKVADLHPSAGWSSAQSTNAWPRSMGSPWAFSARDRLRGSACPITACPTARPHQHA